MPRLRGFAEGENRGIVDAYIDSWGPHVWNERGDVAVTAEIYGDGVNTVLYFDRENALKFARSLHDAAIAYDYDRNIIRENE